MDSFFLFTSCVAAITLFMLLGTICFMFYRKFRFHQEKQVIAPSSQSPSSSSSSLALSSSPSSLSRNRKHHVFPSFHGAEVRKTFLSHVLPAFRRKGIDPFIDNDIDRSKSINPALKEAIRGSRIAIVVLSKNYASSTWCMNELVEIMKCREELGQIVMTIFYELEPSDVKKQTGDFGKAFRKTCKGKTKEETETWRKALEDVATIAGYHSSKWDTEAAMIEKIATDVSNMLNNSTPSRDFDRLVGMGAHMEKIEPLLRLDLQDEVRMIGIWGPPGIGKTTLARYLFNRHSKDYQLSGFMENIKESMHTRPVCSDDYNTKLHLHKQFMSQITKHKDTEIPHLGVAEYRLNDKKVLIVLDSIDQLVQLEAMANKMQWFGHGSRIIITTQDQKLLKAHGINHIYKVDVPSRDEAYQIFCTYAFDQMFPEDGFEELVWEITKHLGELPLGLRVMGSHFRGLTKQEWRNALPRVRTRIDASIQSILKFSYDALDNEEKELFLYIACFFNGEPTEEVEEILAKNFLDVRHSLRVLADKSLISDDSKYITMHELLVKLGREIIRHELGQHSIRTSGKRRFLVDAKDICEVLSDDTKGSKSIIGIDLNLHETEDEFDISERALKRMSNLEFLRLSRNFDDNRIRAFDIMIIGLYLPQGLYYGNYLPPKLRLLEWDGFPMTRLPFDFCTEYLVSLALRYSKLQKLWEENRPLGNLKYMNLSNSENLKELPDLSTAINLQELILHKCSSLVELPSSIGNASKLIELCLRGCKSLVELPSFIGNTTNLQKLYLDGCINLVELPSSIKNATNLIELSIKGCTNLGEIPSFIGNANNLQKLYLDECISMVELPSSIGNATNLIELCLRGCTSLVELPSSIGNATNLQNLFLDGCTSLVELPPSIGNASSLSYLSLKGCTNLGELPSSIGNANNLQKLYLDECTSLVELPSSIGNARSLSYLSLIGCSSLVELPSSIGNVTNLQELYLDGCISLVELPPSIGNASSLSYLSLKRCTSLLELPSSIENATNIQNLFLDGCTSLVELPPSIGNASSLSHLSLIGCSSMVKLPLSIGNITNLQTLYLDGCTSLIELPPSIGNLHKLKTLSLSGCSRLEVLPTNINLESLETLDCTDCVLLRSFPEISTNITNLQLKGTPIKEIPSSIKLWSRLKMQISYVDSLQDFRHALEVITKLYLNDIEIQEIPSCVKRISCLKELIVKGCKKLISLPQLPDSLSILDAENCESLERLDCSFQNPRVYLNFANCLRLNKEAREIIIRDSGRAALPGGEVPAHFTHRGTTGSYMRVNLNQRSFSAVSRVKACISLVNTGVVEARDEKMVKVSHYIMVKQNGLSYHEVYRIEFLPNLLADHLYMVEVEAKETSNEVFFNFKVTSEKWGIGEGGIYSNSQQDKHRN